MLLKATRVVQGYVLKGWDGLLDDTTSDRGEH